MSSGRLLIIESLSADRYSQYRNAVFPFLSAFARQNDIEVRWLCFGYDPDAQPTSRFVVELAPEDAERLVGVFTDFSPTHVVHNDELGTRLGQRLRQAATGARWQDSLGAFATHSTVSCLARWLVLPASSDAAQSERALADAVVPDWSCELMNEAARSNRPFVEIQTGALCLYRAPLARNPHYEGVRLEGCNHDDRCAFCSFGVDRRYPFETPAEELALRQIQAAQATCPPERYSGVFLLSGLAVARLNSVLAAVLGAPLAPCDLRLCLRIDELRRKAEVIEVALPRLAAAGHRLSIYNMGIENASPTENERFNKGISREDVTEVARHLRRWRWRFPGVFPTSEREVFGSILFTPWTTFADLRANLDLADELDVNASSAFFVSRVQLLPDRPLTRLALRDGHVVEPEESTDICLFDSGCVTHAEDHERPWRFSDRDVALVYRLAVLIHSVLNRDLANVAAQDRALPVLAALLESLPEGHRTPSFILRSAMEELERRGLAESLTALTRRLGEAPELRALASRERDRRQKDAPGRAEIHRRAARVIEALGTHPRQPLAPYRPALVEARGDRVEVSFVATGPAVPASVVFVGRGEAAAFRSRLWELRPQDTAPEDPVAFLRMAGVLLRVLDERSAATDANRQRSAGRAKEQPR